MLRIVSTLILILFLELTVAAQTPTAPEKPGPDQQTNETKATNDDDLFIESIKTGDVSTVLQLLDQGVGPDTVDHDGTPALHWAVRRNRLQVTEILLTRKAEVDQDDHGRTALQIAALEGRSDLVKLLMTFGADVNYKGGEGHTALMCAAFGATIKSAPVWMAASFYEIEEADDLLMMMGNEHNQVLKLLLDAGADVNAQGGDCGLSTLMIAAMGGNVELTKLLLDHRADVKLEAGEYTPLKFAEASYSDDALREIEDPKAKQDFLNWLNFTAPGRQEVARMLRKAGAN